MNSGQPIEAEPGSAASKPSLESLLDTRPLPSAVPLSGVSVLIDRGVTDGELHLERPARYL